MDLTSTSSQSFWKICPSFWTDCIFQNCFLWLTDGNSLVMTLLFISMNNLQVGMIKISMWLFISSHKEHKAMKVFTYCSSKKVRFENLGEKEERHIATTSIFISSQWCRAPWLWRHVQRDICAALHPAPVRAEDSRRRCMGQASWLGILKLVSVQAVKIA